MEVIKAERYPYGDMTRYLFIYFEKEDKSLSSYFLNLNRGKKSICVNLRTDKGREIIYKLIEKCDVIIENFQVGGNEEAWLRLRNCEESKSQNRLLLHNTFGQHGSYSSFPEYDLLVQTLSGYIWRQADSSIATTSIGDTFAGTHAALAIVPSLLKREKTGEGEYIDISMSDCLLHSYENILAGLLLLKSFTEKEGKL
ncbi:MAG: hypothetical protein B9J98_02710 [Candidatus Terraquivivens tikiterensis]|uniref:Uncharacterized protein n=1 Tax=Candidatus Terraquivivens tikiterensis TaxID=1980982 RepID=A0A2R7Y6K2_9ARCH|nr:MAG: hypothetical protein B9J98_02710 [Candidatus Terraquivivens tikiterensis]